MAHRYAETRKDAASRAGETRDFRFDWFAVCLTAGGLAVFLSGVVIDNILQMFDIAIASWQEAGWSAIFGTIFAAAVAPFFWRFGLVTLPQYLLGATGLFVPLTMLSVAVMNFFWDVRITGPDFGGDAMPSQVWALTAYVRIARSAVFMPVFLLTFWFMFHRVYKMKPPL
jgi:hypothetical protein